MKRSAQVTPQRKASERMSRNARDMCCNAQFVFAMFLCHSLPKIESGLPCMSNKQARMCQEAHTRQHTKSKCEAPPHP